LFSLASLAAVNFFLGMVGVVQVSRILMYQQSQKALEAKAAEEAKKEVIQA
jgi:mitochondrial pyruvate carrier 2